MSIHPTAIVDPRAEIDPTATIGPYVIVDGPVRVGPRTTVGPHCHLTGWTEIGADCRVFAHVVIGEEPQDLAYKGERSFCRVGDGNIIREGVTIHRGTGEDTETVLGSRCFLMANSHIGHNCRVGDEVKLANGALLAGHVQVQDAAFISGNGAVHQFVRIGERAMIGGLAVAIGDVPPFMMTINRDECVGVNLVGIRRAGFSAEQRQDVQTAYRILFRSDLPFPHRIEQLTQTVCTDAGQKIVAFLTAPSKRTMVSAPKGLRTAADASGLA